MQKIVFSLLLLFSFLACSTSNNKNFTPNIEKFPSTWLGEYKGRLQVLRPGSDKNAFPANVHLSIANTTEASRWKWTTSYAVEGRDTIEKKYFIMHPDSLADTNYLMDEDNGIFINQYHFGNTFYGAYTVNNQFFTFSYQKEGDVLDYELAVYAKDSYEKVEVEKDFVVGKIDLITIQKVRFKKIK